jgi:hypothetical protein
VVCRSAIAGKSPGEAMASAFILAKTSRSPLKKLQDRLIPTAAIGNGDRPPSPQGEGGHPGQDMLPPSPGHGGSDQWPPPPGHEKIEREEGQDFDDSKEAERPAGNQDNQALPTASNPGARGGVNYGGGSQGAKDAREKSASRWREQQRARETAGTYQRPALEEAPTRPAKQQAKVVGTELR